MPIPIPPRFSQLNPFSGASSSSLAPPPPRWRRPFPAPDLAGFCTRYRRCRWRRQWWPPPPRPPATAGGCERTYGFLPCTESAVGNLFLAVVYGYLMFNATTYLSSGIELLLEVLGSGIIGGLFSPLLGALPRCSSHTRFVAFFSFLHWFLI